MREQGIMISGGRKNQMLLKKQRMMALHNANYQSPRMFNADVTNSYGSDQGQNQDYIQETDEAENTSEKEVKVENMDQA